jgi:hypothetical protein
MIDTSLAVQDKGNVQGRCSHYLGSESKTIGSVGLTAPAHPLRDMALAEASYDLASASSSLNGVRC